LKKYLELIRLPNILTAACDVWAGYFIILAMPALRGYVAGLSLLRHVFNLILLVLAGSAFYAVGTIFNDIVDFERDKISRPQRPLPSGKIALNVAFGIGAILSVAAMLLCMLTGSLSRLVIGFALLACIVTYTIAAKRSRVAGPPFMGLCRALNIALGMGLTIEMVREAPIVLLAPAIMFAYIVAVTVASFAEESAGLAEVVVKWGVLGVALLDAVFLMAYGQMLASIFCLAMLVGAVLLSKKFAVA
jgi:4-hydroxybenzoate polyprenyltransferase